MRPAVQDAERRLVVAGDNDQLMVRTNAGVEPDEDEADSRAPKNRENRKQGLSGADGSGQCLIVQSEFRTNAIMKTPSTEIG